MANYINILESTKVIRAIRKYSTKLSKKPEKLLFGNTNTLYTFASEFGVETEIGTVRESFFVSCFDRVYYSEIGDFVVGDYIFEIGGKNKTLKQIKDVPNGFLVIDTDYTVDNKRIPLWLFGLMD